MTLSAKQAAARAARETPIAVPARAWATAVVEAVLVSVDEAGVVVTARVAGGAHPAPVVEARVLATAGFRPRVGDRVALAGGLVIGAIEAAEVSSVIALADGAVARVEDGALALRDERGALLLRYKGGAVEVTAPAADLTLAAPRGRVVIEAATDVSIAAARDLVQTAGRKVEIGAGDPAKPPRLRVDPRTTELRNEEIKVEAKKGSLVVGEGTVVARALATTAESLAMNVARYELTAQRIVERAGEAFRDVTGLLQQRLGRARTLVTEGYELRSKHTTLESEKETSIDGEKILIG